MSGRSPSHNWPLFSSLRWVLVRLVALGGASKAAEAAEVSLIAEFESCR